MLAFDLGASSGRAILGILDEHKLIIEELHRFSNDPVEIRRSLYWDILRLFHEIKQGILKCIKSGHRDIDSIAVDTWGVDFGLLDKNGTLLGNPYHYRNPIPDEYSAEVFKLIPREELYSRTGIQIMKINTLFQLYSFKRNNPSLLSEAKTLLMIPDLLNYFLTGVKATEYSIASTSQLLSADNRDWDAEIIERLGLPENIFTKIVPGGSIIGTLSPAIANELGIGQIPIIAAAGHDTQAAIAAVPARDNHFAYISCGTWSLMGIETTKPVINEKSAALSFTNEGGIDNRITFLKNITALWLVQECKRQWDREGDSLSYAELEKLVWEAKPFVSFVDPDNETFIAPGNMPQRIREYCRKTNQIIPEGKGDILRCIAQSLAIKYRLTVESLEEVLGKALPVIHMVGGGIKDEMLCRFTANATGRLVETGPVEATAIGNLMIQAKALGRVKTLEEIRDIVARSFPTVRYEPSETTEWGKACKTFKEVVR